MSNPTARRNVLIALGGGVVALAAIAAPSSPTPSKGGSKQPAAKDRSLAIARGEVESWTALVGSPFLVQTEIGALLLKLTAVQPLQSSGPRPEAIRDSAFAAVFSLEGQPVPAGDRVYSVRHPAHGDLGVYFSPAAKNLVAVFN